MVRCHVANVDPAGSIPVARSSFFLSTLWGMQTLESSLRSFESALKQASVTLKLPVLVGGQGYHEFELIQSALAKMGAKVIYEELDRDEWKLPKINSPYAAIFGSNEGEISRFKEGLDRY